MENTSLVFKVQFGPGAVQKTGLVFKTLKVSLESKQHSMSSSDLSCQSRHYSIPGSLPASSLHGGESSTDDNGSDGSGQPTSSVAQIQNKDKSARSSVVQPFEGDTIFIADASNFVEGDRSDIETFQSDDDEPTTSLARIQNKKECTGFSDMLPFEQVVALTTVRTRPLGEELSNTESVKSLIVEMSLSSITKGEPVIDPTSARLLAKDRLCQIADTDFSLHSSNFIASEEVAAVHRYEPLYPQSSLEDLYLWILMEFSVCHKMMLFVARNCTELQNNGLAGAYISALVLEPLARSDRQNVVKLKRLVIDDVLKIAQSFAEVAPELYDAWSNHRLHNAEFSSIQERLNTAIRDLELWDDDTLTILFETSLQQNRVPNKAVIERHTAYFSSWRGIIETLDLMVISFAHAHVYDINKHFPPQEDLELVFQQRVSNGRAVRILHPL